MKHALVWLLVSTCLAACHSAPSKGSDVPFRSIARGYQTALPDTGVLVARSADEWRALWTRHAASVIPRPDLPKVDFDTDMIVCVLLGSRPTYGYAIEIARVIPNGDGLRIEVVERSPASDAITNQVVTQPFHMIATARRGGTVELAKR